MQVEPTIQITETQWSNIWSKMYTEQHANERVSEAPKGCQRNLETLPNLPKLVNEIPYRFLSTLSNVLQSVLHGYTIEECNVMTKELFRGLICKSIAANSMELSLPPKLDIAWHALILETNIYREFCEVVTGRYLEHTQMTISDSLIEKNKRIDQCVAIYKSIYHERPDPWCWQRENESTYIGSRKRSRFLADAAKKNSDDFNIFCRMNSRTDKIMAIIVTNDMRIETLKRIIQVKRDIRVHDQRLIYAGKNLDDKKTIECYSLTADADVHLILRLCGC